MSTCAPHASAAVYPFAGDGSFPDATGQRSSNRIEIRPDDVRKGLGKLVLTVVELIRQLLEKQAQRRVESGTLTPEEVERLGVTFLGLSQQLDALKLVLGLEDEELNVDLGPLGKLL
jgi:hypothetical protein